jgi:hypothetical protein
VGLSMGITPYLSWAGKFFISVTMFIGEWALRCSWLCETGGIGKLRVFEENLMVG